jgi:predicted nucleic acid-binding protein
VKSDGYILDTGPLVAYLSPHDYFHSWASSQFDLTNGRPVTCEAVLTEAFFLLRAHHQQAAALEAMVSDGVFGLSFSLGKEAKGVMQLCNRYRDVPMSLADACLVRLSELNPQLRVLTLDADFRVYRRNRRQSIPLAIPAER